MRCRAGARHPHPLKVPAGRFCPVDQFVGAADRVLEAFPGGHFGCSDRDAHDQRMREAHECQRRIARRPQTPEPEFRRCSATTRESRLRPSEWRYRRHAGSWPNRMLDCGEHLVANRLTVLIADAFQPIHAQQRDTQRSSASFDTGPFTDERLPFCATIEHASTASLARTSPRRLRTCARLSVQPFEKRPRANPVDRRRSSARKCHECVALGVARPVEDCRPRQDGRHVDLPRAHVPDRPTPPSTRGKRAFARSSAGEGVRRTNASASAPLPKP